MIEGLLRSHFPVLADKQLKDKIMALALIEEFDQPTILLRKGQYIKYLPLVVKGSISVSREEEGKELLLYYIKPGESCAMSLSAYLHKKKSEVTAQTAASTQVILLPTQHIDSWLRMYPAWQDFVLQLYHYRFEELLETIDQIAFHKLDERLWQYLQKKAGILDVEYLEITHQQIAEDLGTSREVVSRILKNLEKKGGIQLSRNAIKVKGLDNF